MTKLSRYEPFSLINELSRYFENNTSSTRTGDSSNVDTSQWIPAVDIKENNSNFIILADLPGIEKKDIQIAMENNLLTLKGERLTEIKEQKENFSRVERVRGSFYRRFTLPDTADGERIQANMKKGVLEITIPKKSAAQARHIEIHDHEA